MQKFIESFLELIYPEKNICCICDTYDESIGEKYICTRCEQSIKKIVPPCCVKCSKPIDYSSSVNLCPDCLAYEKFFESSKSLYSYNGLIKKCIYNFKYYNKPYYFRFFGNSLVQYMNDINYKDFDFILSVPLHSSKMKIRGYNQSELIAKYISGKLNIPYMDVLKRIKNTNKQSSQTKEDRRKNLKNAFAIKQSKKFTAIINSSVLLVDDIYTTGSTANECAKALIDYGVSKVYVITIAR